MRKLKINRADFETAFDLNDYDTTCYLDSKTGDVLYSYENILSEVAEVLTEADTLESAMEMVQAQGDIPEWTKLLMISLA